MYSATLYFDGDIMTTMLSVNPSHIEKFINDFRDEVGFTKQNTTDEDHKAGVFTKYTTPKGALLTSNMLS